MSPRLLARDPESQRLVQRPRVCVSGGVGVVGRGVLKPAVLLRAVLLPAVLLPAFVTGRVATGGGVTGGGRNGHGRRSGHVRLRSDGPAQSGWCGPDQGARPGLPQTPGGRALHPVIVAASTGNIAGTRQAALIVGDRVIKVAPRRRPAADREPAVLVTHLNQVPHPVGDPVSGGGVRVGARDAGTAVRVIGVRVIANPVIAVRGANLAGRRRGSRQDGPQRVRQLSRRIQASLRGGRWLIQESDRHRDGDPPEHAGSGHPGSGHPGSGHPGSLGRAPAGGGSASDPGG